MKTKKIKILTFLIVTTVSLFTFLILIEKKVTFYIGMAGPSKPIDVSCVFDNKQLYEDSLIYAPWNYVIIDQNVRGVFHKLIITSNEKNIKIEKYLTVLINQHIVIEYFPNEGDNIYVRNRFTPYYLE